MKTQITKKTLKYYGYTRTSCFHLRENIMDAYQISPDHFNAGVYGWNWDCWIVGGLALFNGYRSFPPCMEIPEKLYKRARKHAEMIRAYWLNPAHSSRQTRQYRTRLFNNMLDALKAEAERQKGNER